MWQKTRCSILPENRMTLLSNSCEFSVQLIVSVMKAFTSWQFINPLKPTGVKWLHFRVFRSNPLFLIFWHSGTLALSPECQNVKKLKRVGQTSMALNALVDSFLPQSEKCGTERVKHIIVFCSHFCLSSTSTKQRVITIQSNLLSTRMYAEGDLLHEVRSMSFGLH